MYPMPYDPFVGVLLMIAGLFAAVAVFAWLLGLIESARDNGERIVRQRFARGEISKDELHVLLQAL
jgi:uncharacterized membrane protein